MHKFINRNFFMTQNIKNIIESLLFAAESPLASDRIRKIVPAADIKEIRSAIQALSEEYETRKGGFFLREVAGGYQICTRPEYTEWVKRLIQPGPVRISKPALETLAIIAYKQPVIRNDIEHIRGVDCGGVLRMLLDRKLVRILGRKEIPGRPLIYATTRQFLEVFNLKDLKDLPTPREIEALGKPLIQKDAVAESATDGNGVSRHGESGPGLAEDATVPDEVPADKDAPDIPAEAEEIPAWDTPGKQAPPEQDIPTVADAPPASDDKSELESGPGLAEDATVPDEVPADKDAPDIPAEAEEIPAWDTPGKQAPPEQDIPNDSDDSDDKYVL